MDEFKTSKLCSQCHQTLSQVSYEVDLKLDHQSRNLSSPTLPAMPGRISVKGKSRKPPKYKNTSETFEFKAAVLSLYDSTTMAKAVAAFWPAIPQRIWDERTEELCDITDSSVDDELLGALELLSCIDQDVSEVSCDDDVSQEICVIRPEKFISFPHSHHEAQAP
eukprot:jgi/Phyca11/14508/fgenesh1_pg.PHYCAscaffold_8_\